MINRSKWEDGRPAVDVKFLAQCLGVPRDTIHDYMLQNWHQCYAARAITDAHRPYDIGEPRVLAEIAIPNAEHWIDLAYDKGKRDGIEMERREWERKIRKLFGMTEARP